MRREHFAKTGFALLRFISFFCLMAFVVTCSFLVFLRSVELDRELLPKNAKATFLNVIFLTLIFCIIDAVRRRLTVEKNIEKIISGLDRITTGDFSVRISPVRGFADTGGFNVIIDRINKMTEELAGVETLQTDFIANVSHELKTPLSAVSNYGTLLQTPGLPEEKRIEYSKAITTAARNLSGLITNILKLNKLENQQIYPVSKPYNLSEQLCECLLNFEDVWEKKQLDIMTDIDDDVIVNADPELLKVVWNNLFSNAVKFTDTGGKIFVTLKREKGMAEVSVTDTGCGISSETGRHIFEKFYQGDPSHAAMGNGLGLALVKRVIDITSCEISVRSEVGRGSRFTVKLRCDEK